MQPQIEEVVKYAESCMDGEPVGSLVVAAQRIAAAALASMVGETLHKALAIAEAIAAFDAEVTPQ